MAIGHQPLDFDLVCYFDNGADSFNLPALESSSSSESLATFRAQIAAENEAEIYERIRILEGLDYYNLPPQNHPGDYEMLVREHFNQAISVDHFLEIYDREYLELQVLERKGILQDRLTSMMLNERNLARIMDLSPYTNVRQEAYNFIQSQLSPVSSLEHAFQRHLMDGNLNSYLADLDRNGPHSDIYREFLSYFKDEEFRRANGLPLP